jgi:GNAT superfamily N-acetyltransferase
MEWWSRDLVPPTLEQTRSKYLPRMARTSTVKAYLAILSGEPVGFIQSYVAVDCGDGWWEDESDPGVRGIDQFLAHGDKLGQGLGTRMVSAFTRGLLAEPGVTRVQADPDPENKRAIACLAKSGFAPIGEIVTPDGVALLMVAKKS